MRRDEMTDIEEICKNCEFFRVVSKYVTICHRYPPIGNCCFPEVFWGDWCGEFREKRPRGNCDES